MHLFSSNRVILALVERQEDRGLVVAQGGGKVSTCLVNKCDPKQVSNVISIRLFDSGLVAAGVREHR